MLASEWRALAAESPLLPPGEPAADVWAADDAVELTIELVVVDESEGQATDGDAGTSIEAGEEP
jgi:hypothetical protein